MKYILIFVMITFTNLVIAKDTYDPYDCLNDVARIDPKITNGLATELCSAAWSPEPAKCYAGASKIDDEIPRGTAVELCAGSVNAKNTLACYGNSGSWELNRGLATTLCGVNKIKN
ncbi:hypothetical protein [Colwellia psychrerythraea]|uniref:Uncharacterized protein n=1 Tax=Colwellia psychrerythraea (strain 34H / ATCC BAA-681) TaxID=167879 RepID=Q484Y5_COLP3|nr:hypothetical protein [Colwellia psychrerythraea]AAZ28825.1 hypothetical protein CPS_1642 [Colwellia psychrerythraea 34H]